MAQRFYEVSQAYREDGGEIPLPEPPDALVMATAAEARGWAARSGAIGFVLLVGPKRRSRYFLRETGGRRYRRVAEWEYRRDRNGRLANP